MAAVRGSAALPPNPSASAPDASLRNFLREIFITLSSQFVQPLSRLQVNAGQDLGLNLCPSMDYAIGNPCFPEELACIDHSAAKRSTERLEVSRRSRSTEAHAEVRKQISCSSSKRNIHGTRIWCVPFVRPASAGRRSSRSQSHHRSLNTV